MEVTDSRLDFIRRDIKEKGITMESLEDNLVDHICCMIEESTEHDFHKAYQKAMESFGGAGLLEIEQNTKILLIIKLEITMKKLMFILGYVATVIISFGAISRMVPLVGGGLLMTIWIAILVVGFFPLFFYQLFRLSKSYMFLFGYVSASVSAIGANLLILHFPNGITVFTIGMILLNAIFLPWFCIKRYKKIVNIIPAS